MKAGEYKIGSVGQQGADPEEPVVPLKSEGRLLENSFSPGGSFCSVWTFNLLNEAHPHGW